MMTLTTSSQTQNLPSIQARQETNQRFQLATSNQPNTWKWIKDTNVDKRWCEVKGFRSHWILKVQPHRTCTDSLRCREVVSMPTMQQTWITRNKPWLIREVLQLVTATRSFNILCRGMLKPNINPTFWVWGLTTISLVRFHQALFVNWLVQLSTLAKSIIWRCRFQVKTKTLRNSTNEIDKSTSVLSQVQQVKPPGVQSNLTIRSQVTSPHLTTIEVFVWTQHPSFLSCSSFKAPAQSKQSSCTQNLNRQKLRSNC